jgi:hypothetical protein
MWAFEPDSSEPVQEQMAECWEHYTRISNGSLHSIKGREFLDELSDY